ncbi:MAG: CoA transferase [Alphaproteobacteria bacterium]|nr:CoA transferase [Alphaproteobacteria bacterium]
MGAEERSQSDESRLPLGGLKVLDLTRVRAGPTAARQLADWGADVLMVEAPPGLKMADLGGPRHGPDFQNLHRNKRSMTLNLKHPEGMKILLELMTATDILIENFRPDVKFRLGLDYESLAASHPRLIYASISGFGQDGPYRDRPGFDQIAQGMGGLMSITGLPGQGPVRAGIAIADLAAGHFAAMGILLAVIERMRSGRGQWVQSSLLQAQIALLDFQAARWLIDHDCPGQAGNDHPTSIPTGLFPTADSPINIAADSDDIFARFCRAIGAATLTEDEHYATEQARSDNRLALNAAITEKLRARGSREWIDLLNQAGVPCGPVYRIDEMFEDPQVRHLGMARPVRHPALGEIELVSQPIVLTRTPSELRTPAPERGEHTDAVLRDLGYDAGRIAELRRQQAI